MVKKRYSSKVFISDTSLLRFIFQMDDMIKGRPPQKRNFLTISPFCEQGSIVQIQVL